MCACSVLDRSGCLARHGTIARYCERHETSPLTYAIETKNAEIVEELLSRGANAAIGKRWSEEGILCMERPLFTALKERQMEISRLLLENGADIKTIGPLPSDWRSPMYRFLKERGI